MATGVEQWRRAASRRVRELHLLEVRCAQSSRLLGVAPSVAGSPEAASAALGSASRSMLMTRATDSTGKNRAQVRATGHRPSGEEQ